MAKTNYNNNSKSTGRARPMTTPAGGNKRYGCGGKVKKGK